MTSTVDTTERTTIPFRGRTTIFTLGVPLAVVAATAPIAWSWRAQVPDPMAVHWGTDGPDGFGSFTSHVVGLTIIPVASAGLLWALGFFAGHQSFTRRAASAFSVFIALVFSGINLATLSVQRGVADARDAGSVSTLLAAVIAIAACASIVAAWLTPADAPLPATQPVSPTAERLALREGEQATWVRAVALRGSVWIIGSIVAILTLIAFATRDWWLALVYGAGLGTAAVIFMHWTVTVDRDGLSVRSIVGRPRLRVPVDEVEIAEVVDVRPMLEFGGWGIRSAKGGRVGVILRKGPALQVHRSGSRIFVVTVDDADTGAALLNTFAERSRR